MNIVYLPLSLRLTAPPPPPLFAFKRVERLYILAFTVLLCTAD